MDSENLAGNNYQRENSPSDNLASNNVQSPNSDFGDTVCSNSQSENSRFENLAGNNYQSWNSNFDNSVSDNSQNPFMDSENSVNDNYQSPNSDFDNLTGNNYQTPNSEFDNLVNISNNGNVQNYGTYMTKRMLICYASWVSFEFQCYVLDIFVQNSSIEIDGNSLIMSTDELHKENQEVNARHRELLLNISKVSVSLRSPEGLTKRLNEYVTWLREEYNLDISLANLYKWLCHMGIFYKDALADSKEEFDLYQPKYYYTQAYPVLFGGIVIEVGGKEIVITFITESGHNAIINDLTKTFPQIKPDTV